MSTLTAARKQAVLEAGAHTCALAGPNCTVFATTVDHWIPRARGGTNNLYNLQPACKAATKTRGGCCPLSGWRSSQPLWHGAASRPPPDWYDKPPAHRGSGVRLSVGVAACAVADRA